jgi:tetratricopeptide (TPR) repeat protein
MILIHEKRGVSFVTEPINRSRVWEETVEIPTYGVGKPDKNPMFLEKRVYQGSSGRVYPHPVIDKIEDDKAPAPYKILVLENEYLRIEIMPEIGGRIYRAVDKTNQYDFVYYNQVIKPALVGLAGPWISGGIEFNWPQHHRPNTFGPVEYRTTENEDGSATVWVSEIDRMYGTKVTAGFTLHPGKAYLEIHAQLYNRTQEPQTFLWWANPAVAVNDHTQSVFPPDVNAVFDHGKRDVSKFPIATGTYYKMDYSEGVDISRYKNIPVPTSYMAYKSDYNFVGGYDHSVQAGLLHVANHHISPGKKQWTWGNGEFGQAWDRSLTDEDGPYIELMTGVYTDNQPDFTWLQPFEEKSFKQYFMPYKNVGVVKNATIEAAVNLEVDLQTGEATALAYATSVYDGAIIELASKRRAYLKEKTALSPTRTFSAVVSLHPDDEAHDLMLTVRDAEGRLLVSYQPKQPEIEAIPDSAKPLPEPQELKTNEQLYLAGLHLEQYRHATFEPEAYYLEGLKRDESDIRINVAYGTLLLRRGLYAQSEQRFRQAVTSLTWRNPNPYDSEAFYQLGVALKQQGRLNEAFAAFYKAVWSAAWQDSGYFSLAQIATEKGAIDEALELAERSLIRNSRNYKARDLHTALLRKAGRLEEAKAAAEATILLDIADFGAYFELYLIGLALGEDAAAASALQELVALTRKDAHNHLALAADYAGAGLYEEAIGVLHLIAPDAQTDAYPLAHLALSYCYAKTGDADSAAAHAAAGEKATPDYCFPNTLFDLTVLEHVVGSYGEQAKAHYFLGNFYYDKKRTEDAVAQWEASVKLDDSFSVAHRNLALAYYNKQHKPEQARLALEKAFACDNRDARVFYELDQLYKKIQIDSAERLAALKRHPELVALRDDLYIEYVTLHNTLGQHEEARQLLASRTFHPWEGGEGKTLGQYVLAHVELAKRALDGGAYAEAEQWLRQALDNPVNLGEAKLAGAQENNVYYYLGLALEGQGRAAEARLAFETASLGLDEPTSAMYYNDQPPEMIFYQGLAWLKLEGMKEAKRRFNKLIDYAEQHIFDHVKIDYFAVSLPDFLVFEEDLDKRNVIHCRFMMGLGLLGLNRVQEAQEQFELAVALDRNHQGAAIHKKLALV